MYGWRARIGLLLPMDNAVIEPELYGLGIPGISFHAARLTTTRRDEMPTEGVRLGRVFVELGADVVVYACAETSFLHGVDANRWIEESIRKETGLPAVTATSAMVEALRALEVRRIGLVTPYTKERTQVLQEFLGNRGFEVVAVASRDFSEGSKDPREWYETNRQPPTVAYVMARQVAVPTAEAVLISGTNLRTLEVLEHLEKDTGRPVISTNLCILWASLGRLGIRIEGSWAGRLAQRPWTHALTGGSS